MNLTKMQPSQQYGYGNLSAAALGHSPPHPTPPDYGKMLVDASVSMTRR